MRLIFLIPIIIFGGIQFGYSQDSLQRIFPNHSFGSIAFVSKGDSLKVKGIQKNLFSDGRYAEGHMPVNIPNLMDRGRGLSNNINYNMPVVKLYGRNSASMPGTEKLDRLDDCNAQQEQTIKQRKEPQLVK